MATIQLRRKTTSGSGPLTGTSGTIKQGEPLVVIYISLKPIRQVQVQIHLALVITLNL